jgi:hypothetical protein
MATLIVPPPIRDEMYSSPGVLQRTWVLFFDSLRSVVNGLSSNPGVVVIPSSDSVFESEIDEVVEVLGDVLVEMRVISRLLHDGLNIKEDLDSIREEEESEVEIMDSK